MYFKLIFLISCLFTSSLFAQHQADNWYFGSEAGLNFATGNPVEQFGGQMRTVEGVASISDNSGNLIFYTNGITVWNNQHQVMVNGTGLLGSVSSTQSAIIVPQPGNDSIFFIFTVAQFALSDGFDYSIVNKNDANGLGAVIIKNVPLLTPTCEKVTATFHCNQKDIWVITRHWLGDEYYAWLISSTGVTTSPVISKTGIYIGGTNGNGADGNDAIGYLKTSPDGKKIASVYNSRVQTGEGGFTELSEFDNATGIVSNSLRIEATGPYNAPFNWYNAPYGVEFSPDSRLLYISQESFNLPDYSDDLYNIVQFDISVHDSAIISQTQYLVDSTTKNNYGALQMAGNQKIYIAQHNRKSLSAINNPNVRGTGCNFQSNAVVLISGISTLGLPTFIQSYFDPLNNSNSFTSTGNCDSLNAQFQVNNPVNIDSVKWNFGDINAGNNNISTLFNPSHSFTTSGSYAVRLLVYKKLGCSYSIDTITKTMWVGSLKINLGNDTTICANDTLILNVTVPNATNLWNDGTTGSSIKIFNPGIYWIKTSLQGCSGNDTIKVISRALPKFTLGSDTVICSNASIRLSPYPSYSNAQYLWSNSFTSPSISVNNQNIYWLQLTDNAGCKWTDSIGINYKNLPVFSLGADTAICEKDSIKMTTPVNGAASYLWSTGETTQQIKAYWPGIYWCGVNKDGCYYRDSLLLTILSLPIVQLGKDTTLCEDKNLILSATNLNATYVWQDGSTSDKYLVSDKGQYIVNVTRNGCNNSDTVNVAITLRPRFNLGPDMLICQGESIVLQPSVNPSWQLSWQDGTTTPTYVINHPGTFSLQAANGCGKSTDEIVISQGLCQISVPKAFTPNNDGKNDTFKPLGVELLIGYRFQIYNRYGQLIFESVNKNSGWSGTFKQLPSPMGGYIYILQYTDTTSATQRTIKGTFVLIR
ncbi:MAG: T9SS type B sorting domain-containing protein [Ferruginibacter sp.]